MIRYKLSPDARQDLVDIRDYYLRQGSPQAARRMLIEFVEGFRSVARNPNLGHSRQDLAGNRPVLFWAVRDYLIIYRTDGKAFEIVAVVRGSRDIGALLSRLEQ